MHRDPEIRPEVRPHFARWVSLWQAAGANASAEAATRWFDELGRQLCTAGFLHRWPMEKKPAGQVMMNPFRVLTTSPHCGQTLE